MFERVLGPILRRYLGNIVTLDQKQLQVGVWSGKLVLHNLAVKPTIFDGLDDFPCDLVKGVIGTFDLQLDWAKFGSVPVRITVSDVYILAKPRQHDGDNWDHAKAEEYAEKQKQAILDAAEKMLADRLQIACASEIKSNAGPGGASAVQTGWLASIFDNIQVSLRNVHICLQKSKVDGASRASSAFACGLTLQELNVQTTDSEWVPTFVKSSGPFVFKTVEMTGLSLYWNSQGLGGWGQDACERAQESDEAFLAMMGTPFLQQRQQQNMDQGPSPLGDNVRVVGSKSGGSRDGDNNVVSQESKRDEAQAQQKQAQAEEQANDEDRDTKFQYMLRPTDASLNLRLSKAHNAEQAIALGAPEDVSFAHVTATVRVQQVAVEVGSQQYQDLNILAVEMAKANAHLTVAPHVRPKTRPFAARAWWRYVYGRVVEKTRMCTWGTAFRALKDMKEYVPLFKAKLSGALTALDLDRLDQLEDLWPAHVLIAWREAAATQLGKSAVFEEILRQRAEALAEERRNAANSSWGAYMSSFVFTPIVEGEEEVAAAAAAVADGDGDRLVLNEKERQTLFSMLGHDPDEGLTSSSSKKGRNSAAQGDMIVACQFELKQASVTLIQDHPTVAVISARSGGQTPRALAPTRSPFLQASLHHLRIKGRQSGASVAVHAELGSIYVRDRVATQVASQRFSYLVCPQGQLEMREIAGAGVTNDRKGSDYKRSSVTPRKRIWRDDADSGEDVESDEEEELSESRNRRAFRRRSVNFDGDADDDSLSTSFTNSSSDEGMGWASAVHAPRAREIDGGEPLIRLVFAYHPSGGAKRAAAGAAAPLFSRSGSVGSAGDGGGNVWMTVFSSPSSSSMSASAPSILPSIQRAAAAAAAAADEEDLDCDLFVKVTTQPLDTVYSPSAISRISEFAVLPGGDDNNVVLHELGSAASGALDDLKRSTRSKLDYVMENRVRMVLDLNIHAPTIIFYSDLAPPDAAPREGYRGGRSARATPSGHPSAPMSQSWRLPRSSSSRLNMTSPNLAASSLASPLPTVPSSSADVAASAAARQRQHASAQRQRLQYNSARAAAAANMSPGFAPWGSFLVINLGRVTLTTKPTDLRPTLESKAQQKQQQSDSNTDAFYDVFRIQVADVEVQLLRNASFTAWQASQRAALSVARLSGIPQAVLERQGEMTPKKQPDERRHKAVLLSPDVYLVSQFTLRLSIYKSLLPDDPSLTALRLQGSLSPVEVDFSHSQYQTTVAILESVGVAADEATSPLSAARADASAWANAGSHSRHSSEATPRFSRHKRHGSSAEAAVAAAAKAKSAAAPAPKPAAQKGSKAPRWILVDANFTAPRLCVRLFQDINDRPSTPLAERARKRMQRQRSRRRRRRNVAKRGRATTNSVRAGKDVGAAGPEEDEDAISQNLGSLTPSSMTDDSSSSEQQGLDDSDSMTSEGGPRRMVGRKSWPHPHPAPRTHQQQQQRHDDHGIVDGPEDGKRVRGERALARLVVQGGSFSFQQRPYDELIEFRLRSLELEDCTQRSGGPFRCLVSSTLPDHAYDTVIATRAGPDLIRVSARTLTPGSPLYDNASKEIELMFNGLHVNWNRSAVYELVDWFDRSAQQRQLQHLLQLRREFRARSQRKSGRTGQGRGPLLTPTLSRRPASPMLPAFATPEPVLGTRAPPPSVSRATATAAENSIFLSPAGSSELITPGPKLNSHDDLDSAPRLSAQELLRRLKAKIPDPRDVLLEADTEPDDDEELEDLDILLPGGARLVFGEGEAAEERKRENEKADASSQDNNSNVVDGVMDLRVHVRMRMFTLSLNAETASSRERGSIAEGTSGGGVQLKALAQAELSGLDVRFATGPISTTCEGTLHNLMVFDTRQALSHAERASGRSAAASRMAAAVAAAVKSRAGGGSSSSSASSSHNSGLSASLPAIPLRGNHARTPPRPGQNSGSNTRRSQQPSPGHTDGGGSNSDAASAHGTCMFWKQTDAERLISFNFISYTYDPADEEQQKSRRQERAGGQAPQSTKYPGYDSMLDLRVTSVQCVVEHSFLTALRGFFRTGFLREARDAAKAKAKRAMVNIKKDIKTKSALFKYNIQVAKPLLFLPHTAPDTFTDDPEPFSGAMHAGGADATNNINTPSSLPSSAGASEQTTPRDTFGGSGSTAGPHRGRNDTNEEYLVLDLGDIRIANSFVLSEAEHDVTIAPAAGGSTVENVPESQQISSIRSCLPLAKSEIRLTAVNLLRATAPPGAKAAAAVATAAAQDEAEKAVAKAVSAALLASSEKAQKQQKQQPDMVEVEGRSDSYTDTDYTDDESDQFFDAKEGPARLYALQPEDPAETALAALKRAEAARATLMGFWAHARKKKIFQDVDICVDVTSPLASLRAARVPAVKTSVEVSTVQVAMCEEELLFLLDAWRDDLEPLFQGKGGEEQQEEHDADGFEDVGRQAAGSVSISIDASELDEHLAEMEEEKQERFSDLEQTDDEENILMMSFHAESEEEEETKSEEEEKAEPAEGKRVRSSAEEMVSSLLLVTVQQLVIDISTTPVSPVDASVIAAHQHQQPLPDENYWSGGGPSGGVRSSATVQSAQESWYSIDSRAAAAAASTWGADEWGRSYDEPYGGEDSIPHSMKSPWRRPVFLNPHIHPRARPLPLMRVCINSLTAKEEARADETRLFEACLASVSLEDIRPDCALQLYRHVIGGHRQSEQLELKPQKQSSFPEMRSGDGVGRQAMLQTPGGKEGLGVSGKSVSSPMPHHWRQQSIIPLNLDDMDEDISDSDDGLKQLRRMGSSFLQHPQQIAPTILPELRLRMASRFVEPEGNSAGVRTHHSRVDVDFTAPRLVVAADTVAAALAFSDRLGTVLAAAPSASFRAPVELVEEEGDDAYAASVAADLAAGESDGGGEFSGDPSPPLSPISTPPRARRGGSPGSPVLVTPGGGGGNLGDVSGITVSLSPVQHAWSGAATPTTTGTPSHRRAEQQQYNAASEENADAAMQRETTKCKVVREFRFNLIEPQLWIMGELSAEQQDRLDREKRKRQQQEQQQQQQQQQQKAAAAEPPAAAHSASRRPPRGRPVSRFGGGGVTLSDVESETEDEFSEDLSMESDSEAGLTRGHRSRMHRRGSLSGSSLPVTVSCLVFRCSVTLSMRTEDQVTEAQLRVLEMQAMLCYRAAHLRLASLNPPPVPVCEPLDLTVEYVGRLATSGDEKQEEDPSQPKRRTQSESSRAASGTSWGDLSEGSRVGSGQDSERHRVPQSTPSVHVHRRSPKSSRNSSRARRRLYRSTALVKVPRHPRHHPSLSASLVLPPRGGIHTSTVSSSARSTPAVEVVEVAAPVSASKGAPARGSQVHPLSVSMPVVLPALAPPPQQEPSQADRESKEQDSEEKAGDFSLDDEDDRQGNGNIEHHLSVEVGALDTCFSFLQISTASTILSSLASAMKKAQRDTQQHHQHQLSDSEPSEEDDSMGGADALEQFLGTFKVSTSGVHVSIVNDAPGYYVPLLNFSLSPLSLAVEGLGAATGDNEDGESQGDSNKSGIAYLLSMGMTGNYYNQHLGSWEPFLEQWGLEVRGNSRRALIQSDRLLTLNITKPCLDTVARGAHSFQTHFLEPPGEGENNDEAADDNDREQQPGAKETGEAGRHLVDGSVDHGASLTPHRRRKRENPLTKASFFRVRNATGVRLRFWPIEANSNSSSADGTDFEHSNSELAPPPARFGEVSPPRAAGFQQGQHDKHRLQHQQERDIAQREHHHRRSGQLLEPDQERALPLRRYIGFTAMGGGAGVNRQWESRSPAVSLLLQGPPPLLQGEWNASYGGGNSLAAMASIASLPAGAAHAQAEPATRARVPQSDQGWDAWLPVPKVDLADITPQRTAGGDVAPCLSVHRLLPKPVPTPGEERRPLLQPGAVLAHVGCRVVASDDGSGDKVLVVSSSVAVKNRTNVVMQILVRDTLLDQQVFEAVLTPGQVLELPLFIWYLPPQRTRLLVRPYSARYGGVRWNWSRNGIRISRLHNPAYRHTVATCAPAAASRAAEAADGGAKDKQQQQPLSARDRDGRRRFAKYQEQVVEGEGVPEVFCCRLNVSQSAGVRRAHRDDGPLGRAAGATDAEVADNTLAQLGFGLSDDTFLSTLAPNNTFFTVTLDPVLALRCLLPLLPHRPLQYRLTLRENVQGICRNDAHLDRLKPTLVLHGTCGHGQVKHFHRMALGLSSCSVVQLQCRLGPDDEASRETAGADDANGSTFNETAPRNGTGAMHAAPFDADWASRWSPPVVVHSTARPVRLDHSLTLRDSQGAGLRVDLSYTTDPAEQQHRDAVGSGSSMGASDSGSSSALRGPDGHLLPAGSDHTVGASNEGSSVYPHEGSTPGVVSVCSPYWFVNRSGLPLLYSTRVASQVGQMTAGQSQTLQSTNTELTDLACFGVPDEDSEWYRFAEPSRHYNTLQGLDVLCPNPEMVGWKPELLDVPDWQAACMFSYSQQEALGDVPGAQTVRLGSGSGLIAGQTVAAFPSLRPLHSGGNRKSLKRACVRLANTPWSKPFYVDTVGTGDGIYLVEHRGDTDLIGGNEHVTAAAAAVAAGAGAGAGEPSQAQAASLRSGAASSPSPADSQYDRPARLFGIGVSVKLQKAPPPSACQLGAPHPPLKVVTFTPRFVLVNATAHALQYRQCGTRMKMVIVPGQRRAIHRFDANKDANISVRFQAYGWEWAGRRCGLAIEEPGMYSVRMRNVHTQDVAVLHVSVRLAQNNETFEITIAATSAGENLSVDRPLLSPREPSQRPTHSLDLYSRHHKHPQHRQQRRQRRRRGMRRGDDAGTTTAGSESEYYPRQGGRRASMILRHHESSVDDPDSWASSRPPSRAGFNGLSGSEHPSQKMEPGMVDPRCLIPRAIDPEGEEAAWQTGASEPVPYRIENFSLSTIKFHQEGEQGLTESIRPHHHCLYAWDEPMQKNRRMVLEVEEIIDWVMAASHRSGRARRLVGGVPVQERTGQRDVGRYSLDVIKKYPTVFLPEDREVGWKAKQLNISVYADGRTRVLRISEPGSEQHVEQRAQQHVQQQQQERSGKPQAKPFDLEVRLAGVGVSLIVETLSEGSLLRSQRHHQRRELMYLSLTRLRLHLTTLPGHTAGLDAVIGGIQIDNQLRFARYPVVFSMLRESDGEKPGAAAAAAAAVGGSGETEEAERARACLQLSVVLSHDKSNDGFVYFPDFSVRLAPMRLNVEEQLGSHLLHFASQIAPTLEAYAQPPTKEEGPQRPPMARPREPARRPHRRRRRDTVVQQNTTSNSGPGKAQQPGLARLQSHPQQPRGGQHSQQQQRAKQSRPKKQQKQQLQRKLILYFEKLEINPIHVSVSYSSALSRDQGSKPKRAATGDTSSAGSAGVPGGSGAGQQGTSEGDDHDSSQTPLSFLLRAVGVTLLNIENAPLRLGALRLRGVFASGDELQRKVLRHYTLQGMREMYKILGASDFLGNPVGLFNSISTGMTDLLDGVQNAENASALGRNLARGSLSLVQHSAYGISNTAYKISDSVTKFLGQLARFDDYEYDQMVRADLFAPSLQHQLQAPSFNPSEEAEMATSGFHPYRQLSPLSGLRYGAAGMYQFPVQGFREDGVGGAVRGAARALIGLVALPVAGVLNMSSGLIDTVRSAVDPSQRIRRMRVPRVFRFGRVLVPLSDYPPAIVAFLEVYLSSRPSQSFFAMAWNDEHQLEPAAPLLGAKRHVLVVTNTHLLWLGCSAACLQGRSRGRQEQQEQEQLPQQRKRQTHHDWDTWDTQGLESVELFHEVQLDDIKMLYESESKLVVAIRGKTNTRRRLRRRFLEIPVQLPVDVMNAVKGLHSRRPRHRRRFAQR